MIFEPWSPPHKMPSHCSSSFFASLHKGWSRQICRIKWRVSIKAAPEGMRFQPEFGSSSNLVILEL